MRSISLFGEAPRLIWSGKSKVKSKTLSEYLGDLKRSEAEKWPTGEFSSEELTTSRTLPMLSTELWQCVEEAKRCVIPTIIRIVWIEGFLFMAAGIRIANFTQ